MFRWFCGWCDLCSCKQSLCCSSASTPTVVLCLLGACRVSGLHPATECLGPALSAIGSRAVRFLYPLSPRSFGPPLYLGGSARSRSSLVRRCHGARRGTALFGGWLLDGTLCRQSWSGAKLLSIFTLPPCLTLSVCVTACLHPPSAGSKRKHTNKRIGVIKRCCLSGLSRLSWTCFFWWFLGWKQIQAGRSVMEAEEWSEWKLGQSGRGLREGTERLGQIRSSSSSEPRPGETKQWRGWIGALVWGERGGGRWGERRRVRAEARASVSGCRLANLSSSGLMRQQKARLKQKASFKADPASRLLLC